MGLFDRFVARVDRLFVLIEPLPKERRLSDPEIVRLYFERKALVALLYEHGGAAEIWPSTLAALRERDEIVIERTPDYGLSVRLAVRPPRVAARWARP